MIRGTTPTLILQIPNRDLRECDIIVTLQNLSKTLNKKNEDMEIEYRDESTYLSIWFSQQDTLAFSKGTADIQVNWLYNDGNREATETETVDIGKNLYSKVMKYGE